MALGGADLGRIPFDDYSVARLIGTAALVLIVLERVVAAGQGKDRKVK
jgi:NhaP-type Na+/H+ and K+/H+ antiporter